MPEIITIQVGYFSPEEIGGNGSFFARLQSSPETVEFGSTGEEALVLLLKKYNINSRYCKVTFSKKALSYSKANNA
ncbi:MAG: hypothetical protein WC705_02110 [Candidatus Paceibacterota bacterium]|jgi:hypothetical protein